MNAMESPLQCFTNQPNSSHKSNTQADVTFDGTDNLRETANLKLSSFRHQLEVDDEDSHSAIHTDDFNIVNVRDCEVKIESPSRDYTDSHNEISTINVNDLKEEPHLYDESSYSASPSLAESATAVVVKKESTSFAGKLPHLQKAKKRGRVSHKNSASKAVKFRHIVPKSASTGTRSRDPADKKHKCQWCDKSFACGYSLTRHVRIHTGEQCYKCDVCDKVFTTRSSKIRHDRTHITQGTYKCEFCNKVFNRPIHLTDHQIEHTGEKPFSCGICGKAFTKQSQLASHLKIHTKGKYTGKEAPTIETCELCGQGFPDNEHLLEHLKEHVADDKALQSDQVDSSNDPDNSVRVNTAVIPTPFDSPASNSPEVIHNIKSEPAAEPTTQASQPIDAYYGDTAVTSKLLVDAQLSLHTDIVYVVGEDGTLQPQINYDLSGHQPYESQPSSGFDFSQVNTAAPADALTIKQEATTPPVQHPDELQNISIINQPDLKVEPCDEQLQQVAASTQAAAAAAVTSDIIPIATADELVNSDGTAAHSVALNHHIITNSDLVIAQADTTSLDSLKTDDEDDDSLSTGLIDGQDILALACQEISGSGGNSTTLNTPAPQFIIHSNSALPNNNSTSSSGGGIISGSNMLNNSDKEKKFHCQYCDKSFTQRNNLDSHTRTHTKEKPFKCAHCDMCFSQRWSLTRHVRIHTGEKPFKCAFCDASFRIKGEKTEHEKTTHMNERNERMAFQARLKVNTNGSEQHAMSPSLHDSISMDASDVITGGMSGGNNSNGTSSSSTLPKIEFSANMRESLVMSMSQTDDSDSRSDYDSVQSSQYGGETDAKYNSLDGVSQDNSMLVNHQMSNENEMQFHYSTEEGVDGVGDDSPVLTTLSAAAFIEEEKALNHHCDFCEASFASGTELVHHYSTHTG